MSQTFPDPSATRIRYEVRGRTAVLFMAHAPVNALDHQMLDELHAGLRRAEADPAVGAIVVTSALPRVYCGGMDLKMIAANDAAFLRHFVHRLYMDTLDLQYALRKPTIAAINGPARGAGMTLSITCDLILAADDIDLGYPELDVGLIPAIHFVHLPRQIGRHRAFDLLFRGRPIPAREALAMGLLNEITPPSGLLERALALGEELAGKSPALMALARQTWMRANDLDYRRNVENQIETLCNAFQTPDGQEGLRAFVEKRAPRWAR